MTDIVCERVPKISSKCPHHHFCVASQGLGKEFWSVSSSWCVLFQLVLLLSLSAATVGLHLHVTTRGPETISGRTSRFVLATTHLRRSYHNCNQRTITPLFKNPIFGDFTTISREPVGRRSQQWRCKLPQAQERIC